VISVLRTSWKVLLPASGLALWVGCSSNGSHSTANGGASAGGSSGAVGGGTSAGGSSGGTSAGGSSGGTSAGGSSGGTSAGGSSSAGSGGTSPSGGAAGSSGTDCPYGAALNDGCSSAPKGGLDLPGLLNPQQVVMLNIVPGSGYPNGTYQWTTTGGGGGGASGTVTVSAGELGNADNQGYTIAHPGSGYTSRPSIVVAGLTGGQGGSITPSVYQATPHNASTPWNVAGVDYHVGIPSGTTLRDPTSAGNLPAGASYASSVVTVSGCNVTLDGFDFTQHSTSVVVKVTSSNCTTTIEDSLFWAAAPALQPIANLLNLGPGGSFVFQRNEYNGRAAIGNSQGSGYQVNDPIQGSGAITLEYNYFHNFDSKVIQVSGSTPAAPFTERYNLFADFGSCSASGSSACAHGEAEYTYGGGTVKFTGQFNTYISHFHDGSGDLTALQAVQADDVQIDGVTDDHNVVIAPGPQATCNANNQTGYVAAAAIYDGQQEGGSLSNVTFASNYIDDSGTYFPWYHATGTGITHTGNVDMGTGGPCNCNNVANDGSCD
jgi:hypothetical protein